MPLKIFKVTVLAPLTEGVRLIKAESLPAVRDFLTDPLFEIKVADAGDVADFYATNSKAVIENAAELQK